MAAVSLPTRQRTIETVIVPLDGSERAERALGPAAAVARVYGAHLLLVTTRWEHRSDEARRYLRTLASRAGVMPVESLVIQDRTAAAAIELVVKESTGPMVVMTTHGRSGLGQALLGSVAQAVVAHVGCPMLLVGGRVGLSARADLGPLVVCVDDRPESHGVLPAAASWAAASRRAVHLVSVAANGDAARAAAALDQLAADVRRREPDGDALAVRTTVLHGHAPAHSLVDYANAVGAAGIAMTTHARRGLGRVALGSVTMAVVRDARCPVLVVGPQVAGW
jgi:nucleotide-binding universal stress UspA family protein